MGMRVIGLQKAINGFTRMEDGIEDAAGNTVEHGVESLMDRSQLEVPKKTRTLANSAVYVEHDMTGPRRSMGVEYGEGALNSSGESYAAAVHEILKASHAPPTKAKYVEDPLVQGIPDYKKQGIIECKELVRKAFR